MTADDTREALTQLLSEVSFMRSCIASGERLNADDLTRQDDVMRRARAALVAARRDPEPTPFSSTSATHYLRDALVHWLRNSSSIEAADDLRTAAAEWLRDIEDGNDE
jgi:hypothetical protein